MSFLMTHLIVAKNLSDSFSIQINSLPQYYLGSISPDAVHNRDNYISDYKRYSHLITGNEKWGKTTDNDSWKSNVIQFLQKHKNSNNFDFILGYCIHVLTDIYNNIHVWTPFRLTHFGKDDWDYDNIHHFESKKIDIELSLSYKYKDDIRFYLEKSECFDLYDIIYFDEIEKQKTYVMGSWYMNNEHPDISANEIRTLEKEMDFIKNSTEYIAFILHNIL